MSPVDAARRAAEDAIRRLRAKRLRRRPQAGPDSPRPTAAEQAYREIDAYGQPAPLDIRATRAL